MKHHRARSPLGPSSKIRGEHCPQEMYILTSPRYRGLATAKGSRRNWDRAQCLALEVL